MGTKVGSGENRIANNTVAYNGFGIVIGDLSSGTVVNNIVVHNYNGIERWDQIIRYYLSKGDLEGLDIDYNFCLPKLRKPGAHDRQGDIGFVEVGRHLFFLKQKSAAIGRANADYLPSVDLFGKKRNPAKPSLGCYDYHPELELKWNQRDDWHSGWPYYFYGHSTHKPDLWDFEATKRKKETSR